MSSWVRPAPGIDPERVAEVLVASTRPGRRGSGYRVSASAVLTAAHVVRGTDRVLVRFNADRQGEWITEGTVEWSDPSVDAAVVAITPRPQDQGRVAPVGFGRMAERDAVVACSAMGFPRFKLRHDPAEALEDGSPSQYRDSAHAVGTIAVLSNRREGTLEVTVPPPGRDPDPGRSPWEGMSGAALWAGGRVVGLIAEHHRADGLGRLAATRVDGWYERLPADRLERLRALLDLPDRSAALMDVVPAPATELLEAAYTTQVRDIAPEELLGRERELAELVEFCAGDEPYRWLRADAWAGKSALAAWFVLHPPAGVTVVSFFVTRRLTGQTDSDAFSEAVVEQLAAVTGEPVVGSATPAGRGLARSHLLDLASRRVGERGQRLLLVVDGLDEDEGAKPGSGKPSIASLLPGRPPDAMRVLVTSRPHPGIPDDVPGDHPLRRCVPRQLAASSFAHDVEVAAKDELMEQLHGDGLQVEIIGLITATGGGLTLSELGELTGHPAWALAGKLGSVFGRSLKTRTQYDPPPTGQRERVYLFAHETLRTIAERELARDLDPYRRRIDAWADDHRARGWPDGTPQYLLRPYGQLLATSNQLGRLVDFATDPGRHDRLLLVTNGDGTAIAEITAAQDLAMKQPAPELAALGRLAVHRDRLASRNQTVPVELPALWVRLGQRRRGEALARSLPTSQRQGEALAAVATALADAGAWDRAEETARAIAHAGFQARALGAVGKALIRVDRERALGLLDDADRTARGIRATHFKPLVMGAVAEALADAGLWERAEQTARDIPGLYAAAGAGALRSVAVTLADAGQWERAEQTARSIPFDIVKAQALAAIARELIPVDQERGLALLDEAEHRTRRASYSSSDAATLSAIVKTVMEVDRDRGLALAVDVEQTARRILHAGGKAGTLQVVAKALADNGHWDHAEQTARGITEPGAQAEALRGLVEALAGAGQWGRAEQTARGITGPSAQVRALVALAKAMVAVDPDRALTLAADAEQLARANSHSSTRVWGLRAVAAAQAAVGQWDRAEQTALAITEPYNQARALSAVAAALAEARQWDRAEQTIRGIAEPSVLAPALGSLAAGLVRVDRDRALALAADAEQRARDLPDRDDAKAGTLRSVAEALAWGGASGRAEQTAAEITDPDDRAEALATVVEALAETRRWDQAKRVAASIADPAVQVRALGALARALRQVDPVKGVAQAAEAEQTADGIADPNDRVMALGALAKVLAGTDKDRAAALALAAGETARGIADDGDQPDKALHAVVEAQADTGLWDQAERTAREIADPGDRIRALVTVVEALLASDGNRDRAVALAGDAEQIARTIPEAYDRAGAYVVITAGLTAGAAFDRPGEGEVLRQRACRLLAKILVGGRWLEALEPLAKLRPSGLAAVDEALQAIET